MRKKQRAHKLRTNNPINQELPAYRTGRLASAGQIFSDGWGTEDETGVGTPAVGRVAAINAETQTTFIVLHAEDFQTPVLTIPHQPT